MDGTANLRWAALAVEELIRHGVTRFYAAPGSRSTPLVYAAATNTKADLRLHFDERGVAFRAVGYARASGRPAAVITTSGTAVANLLPGVVEASQDGVPIILLTADRPQELRDTGANQTIDQVRIFGSYVRWQIDLPCPSPQIVPEFVLSTVDQAVYRATGPEPGPVHLNCPFRKPLLPSADTTRGLSLIPEELSQWYHSTRPYNRHSGSDRRLDAIEGKSLIERINAADNGLLIGGALRSKSETEALKQLSAVLGWPTVTDITSGLRMGGEWPNRVGHFELLLASRLMPAADQFDMILHVGGGLVSDRFESWLQANPPRSYVRVAAHPRRLDPTQHVTERCDVNVADFCRVLAGSSKGRLPGAAAAAVLRAEQVAAQTVVQLLSSELTLTEPEIACLAAHQLSLGDGLFLGNSQSVRLANWFTNNDGPQVVVGCNRGASGIDGTIASAVGFAEGLGRGIVVLLGDLALLHDLNSLALMPQAPQPMVLVVINNNGGGLFTMLPIASHTEVFERCFVTPHGLTLGAVAQQFGLGYFHPKNSEEFVLQLQSALRAQVPALIEVTTRRDDTTRLFRAMVERLRSQA